MQIESFQTVPLPTVIPSYLYQEYSDDDNLQAFVNSFNGLANSYLDWFTDNPFAVYTSPGISGPLLDWLATGIYGIPRPVLSNASNQRLAGFGEIYFGELAYGTLNYISTGASNFASDDLYKRTLTWNLYKGDGKNFSMSWLKKRIGRFLLGSNGTDVSPLNGAPSIIVSNGVFTVSFYSSTIFSNMQALYANGALSFPFMYSMTFNNINFLNDGSVLTTDAATTYPTTPNQPAGSVWWNGGVISVVPGITPDPSAAPLYFSTTTPLQLLELGGGNLPLSNPGNTGQLWNNGGVVSIS